LISHTKRRTQTAGVSGQVLRIIFGPKREDVAGGWRRVRNEELQMGRAYSKDGRDHKCIEYFGW
jgi:hypothetical protein